MAPVNEDLLLIAVVDMAPGHAEEGRAYEDAVLALLGRHGGVLERRFFQPDGAAEVHVIRFAGRAGYEAFMADPERLALRERTTPPTTRVLEVYENLQEG
ncbi:hypothetical protein AB0J83_42680 [Actinoplanes sp. NPDC049596]|uniref:hypothetical protein n=1 Tax=unclassified Actinoplanes TaxID=2626549 RepID=UPI0034351490